MCRIERIERRKWLTAPALALLLAFVMNLPAAAGPPSAGSRVRVTHGDPGVTDGDRSVLATWLGVRDSSLVLQAAASPETLIIPLAEVTRLEVGLGAHGRKRGGAIAGGVAGGLAGCVFGIAIGTSGGLVPTILGERPNEDQWLGPMLAFGAIGAFGGGLAGALIGSAIRSERWRQVPLGEVMKRVDGRIAGDACTLALRVRF